MERSGWWWVGGLVVMLLMAGCWTRQPAAQPSEAASATHELSSLTVDGIQLVVQDRLPARIVVQVTGTFPDTCSQIDQINVGEAQPDNVIPVTLVATRPTGGDCPQTATPFEESFQLPVENLPPGVYTVNVEGHTATIALSEESIPIESANVIDPPRQGCPAGKQETPVYLSTAMGMCFLFIQDYEVQEPDQMPGSILVRGAVVEGEGPEPIGPSLTISVWQEDVYQQLDTYVDDLLAEADQSSTLTRTQEVIGGHRAVVVEGLPDAIPSRQAWVNVDGTVFSFKLQPLDWETYPVGSAQAEELWNTVLPSLVFFPLERPTASDAWQTYDLPEFGVRVSAPADWTLFRGEGFAALGAPGGNPNMVTIGVLSDLPLDPDALTDALQARYQSQGEPDAKAGPMLIDDTRAVRFTGLLSLCLDVFVPVPAAGVVRQISIHQDACPDSAPTDTIIDILNSIELIEP